MHNQLNDKLIDAIKQSIPQGKGLAAVLMGTLSLGKEAIYRRLRNEVPFTFEEVVKISQKFGISLENLIDRKNDTEDIKWAVFNVDMLYGAQNYIEKHCEKLEMLSSVFNEMQCSKKTILRGANSFIPYSFILPFENLSRFRHYKWIYLEQGINPHFRFSDLILPDHAIECEKRVLENIRLIPRTLLILDKNIFSSLLSDINYFSQRELISEEELAILKEELLSLISLIEKLTATGTYDSGTEITLYLSEINIGSTYTHIEYDDNELGMYWPYFMDMISFHNSKMSQRQKQWIELLKRYSIQITQTGEIQRFEFLNKQRQLVENLDWI